jgi:hypothetical protein
MLFIATGARFLNLLGHRLVLFIATERPSNRRRAADRGAPLMDRVSARSRWGIPPGR